MSDFKEGDLLDHRASGERCVFIDYPRRHMGKTDVSRVITGLGREGINCLSFELTKVKEESNG